MGSQRSTQTLATDFESRLRPVRSRAYAHALMLTRNVPDAEDLLQTTLLKAWSRYETYDQARSFGKWLSSIMLRTFLDRKRADGRRIKAISLDTSGQTDEGETVALDFIDPSLPFETSAIERMDHEPLRDALKTIPDVHRRVVIMYDLFGYDYNDCAAEERIPVGTVRSRLFRGRQKLREMLAA